VLYCVSPGNALAVTDGGDGRPPRQESGRCPASFRPPNSRSILRRLNPSIWIGQAF
jgi:outer membrane protein insertion porin family/translocation and assembly module TamA